eukprot:s2733_g9.t1
MGALLVSLAASTQHSEVSAGQCANELRGEPLQQHTSTFKSCWSGAFGPCLGELRPESKLPASVTALAAPILGRAGFFLGVYGLLRVIRFLLSQKSEDDGESAD